MRSSTAQTSGTGPRRPPRDGRDRAGHDEPVEPADLSDRLEQLVPVELVSATRRPTSTSLAVMIPVSGERRSWLTGRRTAVFTSRFGAASPLRSPRCEAVPLHAHREQRGGSAMRPSKRTLATGSGSASSGSRSCRRAGHRRPRARNRLPANAARASRARSSPAAAQNCATRVRSRRANLTSRSRAARWDFGGSADSRPRCSASPHAGGSAPRAR